MSHFLSNKQLPIASAIITMY